MKTLIQILFISLLFNIAHADELSIGIKEAKPFAYQVDGKWEGISVDLIKQLSKHQNFTYSFVPFNNTGELLANTSVGNIDLGIAAISVTLKRERGIDFSHKYFTTSLGILSKDKSSWWSTTIWIAKRIAGILVVFIIALYLVGGLIAKVEGDKNIVGGHNGAWWALVTFSTTGYGDEVPKTNKGKIIASTWIIASLFLISIFTGYISSTLTVKKLTESPTGLADLYNVKVVAVTGSTAQQRLNSLGIKHTAVENLSAAFNRFNTGVADAIVHDDAMLNFEAKSMDSVTVWPIENSEEDYAIALPPKSPLTESVNLGILKILASPEWKASLMKYNVL